MQAATRFRWRREWLVSLMGLLVCLAVWEFASRAGWLSTLLFPAPTTIGGELLKFAASGELAANTAATLTRVGLGFILGGGLGLTLGLAMGNSHKLRAIADPLVAATNPIPKIALLPLLMVVVGIGDGSRVLLIALAAFYPMLLNAMAGVRHIDRRHFEAAKSYGARPFQVWTRIVVPGSLPFVLVGSRIGLNVAFLLAIAVDLVNGENGLGQMIWFSWETLRTTELYAVLFVIALLGIGFNVLISFLSTSLTPWHFEPEE